MIFPIGPGQKGMLSPLGPGLPAPRLPGPPVGFCRGRAEIGTDPPGDWERMGRIVIKLGLFGAAAPPKDFLRVYPPTPAAGAPGPPGRPGMGRCPQQRGKPALNAHKHGAISRSLQEKEKKN